MTDTMKKWYTLFIPIAFSLFWAYRIYHGVIQEAGAKEWFNSYFAITVIASSLSLLVGSALFLFLRKKAFNKQLTISTLLLTIVLLLAYTVAAIHYEAPFYSGFIAIPFILPFNIAQYTLFNLYNPSVRD